MNKYITRFKEFTQKHEVTIAVVVSAISIVLIKDHRRNMSRADACLGHGSHVYLNGEDMKFVEEGNTVEFWDVAIMSTETWKKLRDK